MPCAICIAEYNELRNSIYTISLLDVPRTYNVGLSTQYRFIAGPTLQPIAGLMLVNRIRHQTYSTSNIETELSDCPVLALTATRVPLHERPL